MARKSKEGSARLNCWCGRKFSNENDLYSHLSVERCMTNSTSSQLASQHYTADPIEWKTYPHTHQYVIPVEWKYRWGDEAPTMTHYDSDHPTWKIVSKLRCACGDEVKR